MRLPGLLLFGVLLQASLAASLPARADTISFDVPNPVPLDGLTVGGVTFGYRDSVWGSAVNARAGVPWPSGFEPSVFSGGVLYADARGVLTLDFARPVDRLGFDLAVSTYRWVSEVGGFELFGPDLAQSWTSVIAVEPVPGAWAVSGHFEYSGAPVSRLVVQVDGMALRWLLAWGAAPPLLVMDNLDYGVAEATGRARASFHTPLPPAGVSLAGALAALLALSRRPRGR